MTTQDRVLVTGGAGFLGTQLVKRLIREGHDVVVVDDFSTGKVTNMQKEAAYYRPNADFTGIGLFDQVYHFASPASPDCFSQDWRQIVDANIRLLGFCDAILKNDGLLVVASSSEAYGSPPTSVDMGMDNLGYVKTQSVRGVYDESKRLLEAMTYSSTQGTARRSLILRIFNTYGPNMPNDGRVINSFVVNSMVGYPLVIHGTGEQSRSFCYVDDLMDQIFKLRSNMIAVRGGTCEVFNVGNDQERTILEAAEIVGACSGKNVRLEFMEARQNDPQWRVPDMSKTWSAIGVPTLKSLEEGVKLCF